MKPLVTSLLLLLLATVHADFGWEKKVIGNVRIEVPTGCKTDVRNTPGTGGAVQRMKKYSFRNRVLDLELVFLSFAPGTGGNLDGAAVNMTAQLKAASGERVQTDFGQLGRGPSAIAPLRNRPDRSGIKDSARNIDYREMPSATL